MQWFFQRPQLRLLYLRKEFPNESEAKSELIKKRFKHGFKFNCQHKMLRKRTVDTQDMAVGLLHSHIENFGGFWSYIVKRVSKDFFSFLEKEIIQWFLMCTDKHKDC